MTVDPSQVPLPERVRFMNALREVVSRRPEIPRNKLGVPLVSDFDVVCSTQAEQAEAWELARKPKAKT